MRTLCCKTCVFFVEAERKEHCMKQPVVYSDWECDENSPYNFRCSDYSIDHKRVVLKEDFDALRSEMTEEYRKTIAEKIVRATHFGEEFDQYCNNSLIRSGVKFSWKKIGS